MERYNGSNEMRYYLYVVESIMLIASSFLQFDYSFDYFNDASSDIIRVTIKGIVFISLMLALLIEVFHYSKENSKVLEVYFLPVVLLYFMLEGTNECFSGPLFDYFIPISGVLNSIISIVYIKRNYLKNNLKEKVESSEELFQNDAE